MSGKSTHGHTRGPASNPKRKTSEYLSWLAMRARCNNPKNEKYPRYGGIGVTVCNRWVGVNGFVNFLSDMGLKPSPKHTIDRFPDRKGNYEPGNCRWATPKEQTKNRDPFIAFGSLKTHCPSGHEYSGENLRVDKSGHRKCRSCERRRAADARKKNK